jgi:hypothetical protein
VRKKSDAAPCRLGVVFNVNAIDSEFSMRRANKRCGDLEEGRLSCAIAAKQGEKVALSDFKRNAGERREMPKTFPDVF